MFDNEFEIIEWEDTSLEYCKLMLCQKVAVLCHKKNDVETIALVRLLREIFGSDIVEFIEYETLLNYINKIRTRTEDKDTIFVTTPMILHSFKNYSEVGKNKRSIIKRYIAKICKDKENVITLSMPYLDLEKERIGEYFRNNQASFKEMAGTLADDISQKTMEEIIRCCQQNDNFNYYEGKPADKYWECYKHLSDEVWINCGAATGDTIVKYVHLNDFKYDKIYAYEGEAKEFKKLCWTANKLENMGHKDIYCINEFIGLEGQKDTFDDRYLNERITLINMDIEGAEMGVLRGASQIIKKWRPVLAICAYHKPTDLLEIPRFVNEVVTDYKIFLRKYRSGSLASFNEYVYYAVPIERCI